MGQELGGYALVSVVPQREKKRRTIWALEHEVCNFLALRGLEQTHVTMAQQEGPCNEPPNFLISCYNSSAEQQPSKGRSYEPVLDTSARLLTYGCVQRR